MCAGCLVGCTEQTAEGIGEETKKAITNQLFLMADNAYSDLIDNYWVDGSNGGYFHNRYNDNRSSLNDLVWQFTMAFLAMEPYYYATGDESVLDYLSAQMET